MSDGTGIQWTDASWNPLRTRIDDNGATLRGWGCQRVSPGCVNCYAERHNHRLGTGLLYTAEGIRDAEHYLDERALTQPLRWRKGRRIFLSSMTDIFGEWVTDGQLDRLFAVMALTPQHVYQVLTKRPERMREYIESIDGPRKVRMWQMLASMCAAFHLDVERVDWPLPNVWLGVSVEDQQRADERIPVLLSTPAAVHFLSCEPLLGPIDLDRTATECRHACDGPARFAYPPQSPRIFVHPATSLRFRDRKGGDWDEWPEDLRVREFPS